MAYRYLSDQRKAQREWYVRNRNALRDKKNRRKKSNKAWFAQYKKGFSCGVCGEDHPACIDFHHIDPSKKRHGISILISRGCSIISLKNEVEKCVPLCSNCHRKEHYKERMKK